MLAKGTLGGGVLFLTSGQIVVIIQAPGCAPNTREGGDDEEEGEETDNRQDKIRKLFYVSGTIKNESRG